MRWALLSVLAFALIGMHSLVTVEPAHMPHTPATATVVNGVAAPGPACCDAAAMEHPGSPEHDHAMQHLCLAILIAVAGLLLGWLWWRRNHPAPTRGRPAVTAIRAGRGPPHIRPTRDILAAFCVLRL